MRSLDFLALRSLSQHRLRTALSGLAVALGVTMVVAADVASDAVRRGVQASDASRDATIWITDTLGAGLSGVGVVILVAAGFLIFNAFAMSITRRRRQIGLLRSLGMTRGCGRDGVMRIVLVEALVTGGLGVLVGLIAGPLLGNGLLAFLWRIGLESGGGRVSPANLLLAAAMGVGMTLLSVLVPARQAARVSPLAALREAAPSADLQSPVSNPRSFLAGLLIAVAVIVYLVVAPPGEWTLPPWELVMSLLLSFLWVAAWLLILPALVGGMARWARGPLTRLWGGVGRLAADNLGRARRRVTLTILTFGVGLTMIVSVTGIITFSIGVLWTRVAESALQEPGWIVTPVDPESSVLPTELDEFDLDTLILRPEVAADVYAMAEGRADVGAGYPVIALEIGAVVPSYPSFIYDLETLTRPGFYTFSEGDWGTALPVMEAGCGLLIPPGVAARNGAGVGDTIVLRGARGPIECTVAGLGAGGYHPASFISPAAKEAFSVDRPAALILFPKPGIDLEAFEADLLALSERHGPNAGVGRAEEAVQVFPEAGDLFVSLLDTLLLLAVLAAALGVVNTTVMGVAERRRELGLLRAVGGTRRQVAAVVVGEAALMGLLGGALGLAAGAGVSVIFAVSHGGNGYGIVDLPLWEAAWEATRPALLTGLLGLVAAPVVSAGAAWLPVRVALRGSLIEILEAW